MSADVSTPAVQQPPLRLIGAGNKTIKSLAELRKKKSRWWPTATTTWRSSAIFSIVKTAQGA
jgi:hypothetical protein